MEMESPKSLLNSRAKRSNCKKYIAVLFNLNSYLLPNYEPVVNWVRQLRIIFTELFVPI